MSTTTEYMEIGITFFSWHQQCFNKSIFLYPGSLLAKCVLLHYARQCNFQHLMLTKCLMSWLKTFNSFFFGGEERPQYPTVSQIWMRWSAYENICIISLNSLCIKVSENAQRIYTFARKKLSWRSSFSTFK